MPSPRPIRRHSARSVAVPCDNRGNQARGTTIVRRSVSSTLRAFSSVLTLSASGNPTSISEVLIPGAHQEFSCFLNQALNAPNFERAESPTLLQSYRMEPELGMPWAALDVDVWWFISVTGVEEQSMKPSLRPSAPGTVCTAIPDKSCRHPRAHRAQIWPRGQAVGARHSQL